MTENEFGLGISFNPGLARTEFAEIARLEAELRRWQTKHFEDTMAAKKSGYEDGLSEMRGKLAEAEKDTRRLDKLEELMEKQGRILARCNNRVDLVEGAVRTSGTLSALKSLRATADCWISLESKTKVETA